MTALRTYLNEANAAHVPMLATSGKQFRSVEEAIAFLISNSGAADMVGASAGSPGTHGLVPAPAAGQQTYFLRGDATWAAPPGGGNVSNTGTPTAGQLPLWTNATTIGGYTVTGDGTLSGSAVLAVTSIGGKAVSLAGAFNTSGAFSVTLTATGATSVTLPTSGTLATNAQFAGSSAGLVPTSVGGTTNYLRADGTWAAPGGGMVYPGAGIANSTGTAWGTSYTVGTGANNIPQLDGAGKLQASILPAPGASTLGGVKSGAAGSHQFCTGVDTSGNHTFAQPAFSDLSGQIASSQIEAIKKQALTASSSTLTIDMSAGEYVVVTLSANVTTLTVNNWPADGTVGKLVLEVRSTGAFNITGWASAIWPGGTAPTVTSGSGKKDIFAIVSGDGGTTKYGNIVGQDFH